MEPIMTNRFEYSYDYMKKVYKQRDRLMCDILIGLGVVFTAYMIFSYIKTGKGVMAFNAACVLAVTFGLGFGYPYLNLHSWKKGMKKVRGGVKNEVIRYEFYDEYFNICNEDTEAVAEIKYENVKKIKEFPDFMAISAAWEGKRVNFDIPKGGFDDFEEGKKFMLEKMEKHK